MIIGIPKRTLLALPSLFKRTERVKRNEKPMREAQPGIFAAFEKMMERQAELVIRGFGE